MTEDVTHLTTEEAKAFVNTHKGLFQWDRKAQWVHGFDYLGTVDGKHYVINNQKDAS